MSDDLAEIQAIFFEECAEGLITAEQGLSAIAAGDSSREVLARVFRAVHSIKGGSGAFGHAGLLAFSHIFESLLDEVRSGGVAPTAEVTHVMLTAFDMLSDHVAAAQGQASPPDDAVVRASLERVLASKRAAAAAAPDPADNLDHFGFIPVAAGLEALIPFDFAPIVADLDHFETAPCDWLVRFRPSRAELAHGGEPMLLIREIERMGGRVESVSLGRLPELRLLDPEDAYFDWTLSVPASVDRAEILECFDFVSPDCIVEVERAAAPDAGPAPPAVDPDPSEHSADRAPPQAKGLPIDAPAQTIRVDLGKLDMLLNLVGELVIRNSILADRLPPADQEKVELPELARLTREIQDNVMSLRAQPIRQAFSRVPRMLRDLMAETGKQVTLETSGEITEVDKGVIEKIGDPLTHMIRNAVDHGIETVGERIASGKPAEGMIRLSAEQKGARIFVRVSDDGRGIDRARVRAKAIEKGIIPADAILCDEEIDQLICAPGFSTSETVSNISGRGVGMDVVRSSVEALGGRVEIRSVPGQGTTFTMALPLTLAILDGMIVRLADQRFVLPLASVVESIQPEPGQVRLISPHCEVIELRGSYLPIKRLTEYFGLAANDRRRPEDCLVIVVESEPVGRVGLMVDTIDDRREVVIKSLDQNLYPIRGLGGATILGDGSIALILDVDALVAPAGQRHPLKGLAA